MWEGIGTDGRGGDGVAGVLREIMQGMSMKSLSKWSIQNRSVFLKESTGCPEVGKERRNPRKDRKSRKEGGYEARSWIESG